MRDAADYIETMSCLQASSLHNGGQDKKSKRGMASEMALQTARSIKAASEVADLMSLFPAFATYERNGVSLTLSSLHSSAILPEQAKWAFTLCKQNMQSLYEAIWGWNDRKKRQELKHDDARFIFAEEISKDNEAQYFSAGYVHFRFEEEDGFPVLYVYEIQLECRYQGKGLGKFLMKLMELIAFKLGMHSVMLTVMQGNTAAVRLYSALGYTKHHSCPSHTHLDSPGYLILHKPIPQKKVKS